MPCSVTPHPNGAEYLIWVEDQAQDKREKWGVDTGPPILEEELMRAAADYKRGRCGHKL